MCARMIPITRKYFLRFAQIETNWSNFHDIFQQRYLFHAICSTYAQLFTDILRFLLMFRAGAATIQLLRASSPHKLDGVMLIMRKLNRTTTSLSCTRLQVFYKPLILMLGFVFFTFALSQRYC